jgi:6-phosphogluconolactonase (cycloisomerase 2 family)
MLGTIRTLLIAILAIGGVSPIFSNALDDQAGGAVFVMTNAADKNEIIAYKRADDGSLSDEHRFATGGRGSGGTTDPLGSQGSLTLTDEQAFLLAMNAGSGEISSFRVQGATLELADVVSSGGSKPVSVAQHGNLVYVANAGGDSNVAGFRLAGNGKLTPIPHSLTFLSTSNAGPGSVAFSPDGQFLVVTEKATNNIDVFRVQSNGRLGPIVVNPSAGAGVFALLFAPNGAALASETGPPAAAISSYAVESNGTLSTISANVPTLGAATCWQAVTPDGRFVYTANSGSSTISGFSIGKNGSLTPLSGTVVATLPTGSTDLDIAISGNGKFLYTLNSGTGTIGIFGIDADGSLSSLGDKGGLPASAGFNGIAAF